MYYTNLKIALLFIVFTSSLHVQAQESFSSLGEHEIGLNHKVSNTYSYNFSLATRHFIYNKSNFISTVRQLDLKHFSTYNLNLNNSISFGIQLRNREWFEGSGNEVRLTQQFNTKTQIQVVRLGHRFRVEQRILKPKTINRFRYRFAVDLPLNGEKLDLGETYLVASNEALFSVSKKIKPELDYRLTTQIGYLVSKTLKLQFGLEYRFEALNIEKDQKLHVLTSAIFKI